MAPGVRRITAPNPGPFTAAGTNTYLVGTGDIAVIDPGPDMPDHIAAIRAATRGERISHILLTHTHRDHSGALAALKAATGAAVLSAGPHVPARALAPGEPNPLEEASDTDHIPDRVLVHGDILGGEGWRIEAIATPGHTANHFAFVLLGADLTFSGDHVMGWSSTIVAPPAGSMGDYMASLDRLAARPERRLFPGHGEAIENAQARIAALRSHRLAREAAILERLRAGDDEISAIVATVYAGIDPRLHGAAALSVLAHIEDLGARGLVGHDGPPGLGGRYRAA